VRAFEKFAGFAIMAALRGLVARATCLIPARKAMRVDPVDGLRHE
jgi:ABC-type lipoprotein release transport system permease subunit